MDKTRERLATAEDKEAREKILQHFSFTWYGPGGVHRYIVRADGSVEFSGGHISPMKTEEIFAKLDDLGFKIHNDPRNYKR